MPAPADLLRKSITVFRPSGVVRSKQGELSGVGASGVSPSEVHAMQHASTAGRCVKPFPPNAAHPATGKRSKHLADLQPGLLCAKS